ncbi:MAG: hypothetical protein NZV14_11230 [Bryobacteraceae bacterium]|nr:hypothetical protein [Bryobacteraceae bacterium]MDW8378725.1 hypothetical protein [Bryobacterales bacterium]
MRLPDVLLHFDWSVTPAKRWLTAARRTASGYRIETSRPAGNLAGLGASLTGSRSALLGFDFPIGLPRAYAQRAGLERFLDAICQFGTARWRRFFEPCNCLEEVSIHRPFFPARPRGANKNRWANALGIPLGGLLRECERASPRRRKACELFWTLGANQVGKAAIAGWRELLQPALARGEILIWPFHGDLLELCERGSLVVAEVYPAEIYTHLGLDKAFGKRSPEGRLAQLQRILSWCRRYDVHLSAELRASLQNGFGTGPQGEDPFDSFVGLLGMIEALQAPVKECWPPYVREIEGWILGMPAPLSWELERAAEGEEFTSEAPR